MSCRLCQCMGQCQSWVKKKRHVIINGVWQLHTFKYPEVVHNHYRYRDMIDNHNSLRMHPLSMEETWMTACWPHCVFCFLLAMTVVNIQNGRAFFCAIPKLDALSARRKIAREFIYNRYLIVEQSSLVILQLNIVSSHFPHIKIF